MENIDCQIHHEAIRNLSSEPEFFSRPGVSVPDKPAYVADLASQNGGICLADSVNQKQNESLSESENVHEGRTKRKRRRRAHRKMRCWRPYAELSWDEKKQLDEKVSLRASRIRAEMFAKGLPVAPYNTTQFLMEDHELKEPDLKIGDGTPKKLACGTDDTSEDDFEEGVASDGLDGGEFLQRDFSETYERYHTESLEDMSKPELIKEYLELERCLSLKEEENRMLKMSEQERQRVASDRYRVHELELEVERLKEENLRLTKEMMLASVDKENAQNNLNT